MEMLKDFGLDPVLLGAQIVNFLIIFFILKKFMYKPVLDMLKSREQTIQDGIQKAEDAQRMLEKAMDKEKEILKNAQNQSKKILEDVKKQTAQMLQDAEDVAKQRTEKMIKEAKQHIEEEANKTEQRLIANVSMVAIQLLQEGLGDLFNEKHQEEIISKAVKKLKNKSN